MRLVSIVNPLRGCNSNLAQYSNTAALRHHLIEHEDEHARRTPNAWCGTAIHFPVYPEKNLGEVGGIRLRRPLP
jgi:hypothetical protein